MKLLFQIKDLDKHFGTKEIFNKASLTVYDGYKIGVMGRNGCGKSTLIKIIKGEIPIDGGDVIIASDFRGAYLEQHDVFEKGETVIEFLMRYTGKEEWKCGKIAGQFDIKQDKLSMQIYDLSGGYQTRVKLISLLLEDPEFIFMDEPTNYLDVNTLILLENFLQTYNGGFMVVSHDREFLKKTCKMTLEVDRGSMTLFPGPLTDYLEFKTQENERIESFNKNITTKQKQLETFINKFKAKASKAKQAKSKQKQLDKLVTVDAESAQSRVKINIPSGRVRNGVIALAMQDATIGYGNFEVARNINFEIMQGEHVALAGANGEGKSTLLKTITSKIDILHGDVKWGQMLKIGFYEQHIFKMMKEEDSILKYLMGEAKDGVLKQEMLDMAGAFLFHGEDVQKQIKYLSGGERARVCLAGLMLSGIDVLILDEPTNHLDFETVETLAFGLKRFVGTVIFVSHDRTFSNIVADRVLEIDNKKVQSIAYTYSEYIDILTKKEMDNINQVTKTSKSSEKISNNKFDYLQKKELKAKLRKTEKSIFNTEKSIAKNEDLAKEIHKDMLANPEFDKDRVINLQDIEKKLEELEEIWLSLNDELEMISKELL